MNKLYYGSVKYLKQILPLILVFIASLYRPYDADLGWHLKYGEHFFKTGQILRDNIYSTMMPDFKWANIAWLTDLISYTAYSLGGFLGLTILGALVVALTFYFFSLAFKLNFFEKALIFPILLILEHPVNQVSFRGQIFSTMFLSILFFLLSKFEQGREKTFYLLIPLFVIWSNTSGQFILGLIIFILWVFFALIRTYLEMGRDLRKVFEEAKVLIPVIAFSILATIIHPFGAGIYEGTLVHFGNKDLQFIAEYLPFNDLSQLWWNQLIVGVLIIFGFMFLFFSDQAKKSIPILGLTSILYGMSWLVRRYAWTLYYLTIPFLKPLVNFFKPDSDKNTERIAWIILAASLITALYIKFPFTQYSEMNWDKFCSEYQHCSEGAAEYIIKNNLTGNLLTFYDLGGWLIFNYYPQIKPSIDGRMHLWRDEKGYSAFSDYYGYEQDFKDINDSEYDVVLMSPNKPMYDRLLYWVKRGYWKKVYEDENAGVFIRVNQDKSAKLPIAE
jgi:hypothetical protein